jgi:hypothetical protein
MSRVMAGDPALEAMAGGAGSSIGRGGMITKVLAAKRAAHGGASSVVCSGREPDVLLRLARGEAVGTAFIAQTPRLAARKQWLADHLQLRGAVRLDGGAVSALCEGGKSLLPIGVLEVSGEFERGEMVAILDQEGREIARGLTNYSSAEARLIARKASTDFERVLGYAAAEEGGAQTASRLAARRARAVAAELSRLGVERDRIRAETRTRGFTRNGADRQAGVRVILMPGEPRPAPVLPLPEGPTIPIRYTP